MRWAGPAPPATVRTHYYQGKASRVHCHVLDSTAHSIATGRACVRVCVRACVRVRVRVFLFLFFCIFILHVPRVGMCRVTVSSYHEMLDQARIVFEQKIGKHNSTASCKVNPA